MRRVRGVAALALAATLLAGCVSSVDVDPTGSTTPTSTDSPATPSTSTTGSSSASTSTTSSPSLHETDLPGRLRVAISFDQPGVGLHEGDEYTGLDADVARYIARYLGISRITFVEAQTDQRETLLVTGQVDLVLASYSMTPQRAEDVTFAGPYLRTGQDLLVRTGSKIRRPSQLAGSTVCSVQGSQSTTELVDNYPGLHLTMRPRLSDCVDLLTDDKVDAVTSDAAILQAYARESRSPDKLRLAGRQFTREDWGVAMRREDTALCEDVSDALEDMVETGAWRRSVRDNLGTKAQLGTRTSTPPKLAACPEPRAPKSTDTESSSTSS